MWSQLPAKLRIDSPARRASIVRIDWGGKARHDPRNGAVDAKWRLAAVDEISEISHVVCLGVSLVAPF
jgi:hypothetical protein